MTKGARLTLVICCLVALAAGIYLSGHDRRSPPEMAGLLWPETRPLPEFQLVDQHGEPFGREQLEGEWTFMFFGFTHCPDVCPLTLQVMDAASDRIDGESPFGADTRFAFVSVDPERDTPGVIRQYIGYFNDSFTGLTGDPGQIAGLASGVGVVYAKLPADENGNYSVDHSAVILLANPAGELVAVFSAPHDAGEIAGQYIELRQFLSG